MDSVKILIIDDEPDITLTLRKGLERSYRVDSYDDPIEALSDFKANVYGLLLLDIQMNKITSQRLERNYTKTLYVIIASITTAPNMAERTRS